MAFIASLASASALGAQFPALNAVFAAAPFLVPLFETLAPLLVTSVNAVLPIILEFLSMFEGPISGSVVQASTFSKLAAFMIIQTFFVSFGFCRVFVRLHGRNDG